MPKVSELEKGLRELVERWEQSDRRISAELDICNRLEHKEEVRLLLRDRAGVVEKICEIRGILKPLVKGLTK